MRVLGVLGALLIGASVVSSPAMAEEESLRPDLVYDAAANRTEAVDMRTEFSRTWWTGGDSYVTEVSPVPLHYLGDDGKWHRPDLSVTTDGDVRGASYRGVAAADGRDGLTMYSDVDGGYVSITPVSARRPDALSKSANIVQYANPWPATTLRYTWQANGVKEEVVLTSTSAPGTFAWHLDPSPYNAHPVGDTLELRTPSGDTAMVLDAPYAVDAKGSIGRVTSSWDLATETLTYTLDPVWRAGAVYPIVIDPSVNISPNTTDCSANQASPDTAVCNQPTFTVSGVNAAANRHFILFSDLSAITPGGTITAASLIVRSTSGTNDTTVDFGIAAVSSSWDTTLTWNNQPAHGSTISTLTPCGTNCNNTFTGLASTVQGWVDGGANNGVVLYKVTENNGAGVSNSLRGKTDGSNPPLLSVTWTVNIPTASTAVPTNYSVDVDGHATLTAGGTVVSTGGDSGTLTKGFQVANNALFTGAESHTCETSAGTGAYSCAYSPSTIIFPGNGTIYVRAVVTNSAGEAEVLNQSAALTMPTPQTDAAGTTYSSGGLHTSLNGRVTDLGSASSYEAKYQYGSDTGYGSTVSVGTLTSTTTFPSAEVTVPGTSVIHYQAGVTVSGVTAWGDDATATIPAIQSNTLSILSLVAIVFVPFGLIFLAIVAFNSHNPMAALALAIGAVIVAIMMPLIGGLFGGQ